MAAMAEDRSEIAFFDVETTFPTRPGQGYAILEFGAILVCPRKFVELRSYSTLVRPSDLSHVSSLPVRCNGISKEAIESAPTFADIADTVYDLLHGRIWAGHNILRFDCDRIREAFAEINRPTPEPRGTIDSLALLTQTFGKRAGDMKRGSTRTISQFFLEQSQFSASQMTELCASYISNFGFMTPREISLNNDYEILFQMATLATYFGLGRQTHRSLDDVRMNLEVIKRCAAVLLLESSLPGIFPEISCFSPNATTRSQSNGKNYFQQTAQNESIPSSSVNIEYHSTPSPSNHIVQENHPILSLMTPQTGEVNIPLTQSEPARPYHLDMSSVRDMVGNDPLLEDNMEEEKTNSTSLEYSTLANNEPSYGCDDFVAPDDILIPSISVTLAPFYPGTQKIQILYQNIPLHLQFTRLKIRFGISTKFVYHAGRPRLSIVVNASPDLCKILDRADDLARKLSSDSGSSSEWQPVVTRKEGYHNFPTVRLRLQTAEDGEITRWATEIYQKDNSATQKLVLGTFHVNEPDSLFIPGNLVDAYFSLDAYDYQQFAGIRLVAKKLIVHSS